ncbi:MAG: PTS IIA-like nitrogen regulatory protein PtsN [Alphaproteobacteria bacterium]|nr:PTS IIA-like nitrogen regulatory protein PtsN [Alphaproteobacteria bacterium]
MSLADILKPEGVVASLRARGKKQALQELSTIASKLCGFDAQLILDKLLARERLGTTGVGQGIAIPHAKFAEATDVVGVFARLDQPLDFESIDDRPVDLIFLLIAPEAGGAEHLRALARVSRLLRNQELCQKLRGSHERAALYALLTEPTASSSSSSAA